MKIKPTSKNGGVVVELGPEESQFPGPAELPEQVIHPRRILVPVDFSDCSKKALLYAVAFAKQFEAEVQLLYVVEPYCGTGPDLAPTVMETTEEAQSALDEIRKTIREVPAAGLVRRGEPYQEIVAVAKETGADLIVISTHGHKGLARMLLGSTAEKVVRYAPCPVLVTREIEREFVPLARGRGPENSPGSN